MWPDLCALTDDTNFTLSSGSALVRVAVAVITKASWGGKDLFGFCFHITVYTQRKSGPELTQGRNLVSGADAEAMEECVLACFHGLLSLLS